MSASRYVAALALACGLAALPGAPAHAIEEVPILDERPPLIAPADPPPPAPVPRTSAGAGLVGVYEYHHARADVYFVTGAQPDVDALETGRIAGWKRTQSGEVFMALDSPAGFGRGGAPQPVCRYFIPPGSHFLSASKAECDAVGTAHPEFVLETAAAFYLWLPNAATGACASVLPKEDGAVAQPLLRPVYRLWNARADTNHRFTTSLAVRAEMIAQGWIAEGYGPLGVAMCAPMYAAL